MGRTLENVRRNHDQAVWRRTSPCCHRFALVRCTGLCQGRNGMDRNPARTTQVERKVNARMQKDESLLPIRLIPYIHSIFPATATSCAPLSSSERTHLDAFSCQSPKSGTMLGHACVGTMALLAVILRSQASPTFFSDPCPPDHVSSCRYIIMMHPPRRDINMRATNDTVESVRIASASQARSSASAKAQDPAWFKLVTSQNQRHDIQPPEIKAATVGGLTWYSTTMDPQTATLIQKQQHEHEIKYLIPDLPVEMYGRVQKHPPSWGLDRIDQRTDKLDGQFHYPAGSGENVTIYIIDTGVNIDHQDFEGRASHGPIFLPSTNDNSDKNGHGTFVAAVAAGTTYGVAKKANIVSLKALDDSGAGRLSNVLTAIEWVVKKHISQGRNSRSIINLSLGAEHNEPTNAAIQEAMKLGVHFSIAAGNDGQDACKFSPASTPGALIVGATDQDDTIASYSNYGPCVAIYAPGSNIVSAWAGSSTATHTQSGTSMASPHVAGLIALMLSESLDQAIPVRIIADRILETVTKFSLNGQLVTDSIVNPGIFSASASSSSSSPSDLTIPSTNPNPNPSPNPTPVQQLQVFRGKALARNLVYIGSVPDSANDTKVGESPRDSVLMSASFSTRRNVTPGHFLVVIVCLFLVLTIPTLPCMFLQ